MSYYETFCEVMNEEETLQYYLNYYPEAEKRLPVECSAQSSPGSSESASGDSPPRQDNDIHPRASISSLCSASPCSIAASTEEASFMLIILWMTENAYEKGLEGKGQTSGRK